MHSIDVVLAMLLAVAASGYLVRLLPFSLPLPLVQIALGAVISGVFDRGHELEPELFFLLFLPPLLFLDGWRIPKQGLFRDKGVILELAFFRPLQHRSHIELGLITFGLALVAERLVVLIWGERTLRVSPPEFLEGTTSLLGVEYPSYRLAIIVIALALAAALVLWLRGTEIGLHIRAASQVRNARTECTS